jgi:hypothetical protein
MQKECLKINFIFRHVKYAQQKVPCQILAKPRVTPLGPWRRGLPGWQNILIWEGGVEFRPLALNWELQDK